MHTGLLSDYTHGVDPHDQVTPPWQGRKYWAVGTVSQTRLTSPVLPQGHVLNALCDEAKGSRAYPEYVPSPTRVYRVSLQAIRECIPQLAIVPFLLRTGNLRCTYYFVLFRRDAFCCPFLVNWHCYGARSILFVLFHPGAFCCLLLVNWHCYGAGTIFVCFLPSRRFLLPASGELALLRCTYYFVCFSPIQTYYFVCSLRARY